MMPKKVAIVLGLLAGLLAAPVAHGSHQNGSGVEQYLEQVPAPSGGKPAKKPARKRQQGSPAASSSRSVLTPETRQRAQALGPDGERAAAAAEATAPDSGKSGKRRDGSTTSVGEAGDDDAAGAIQDGPRAGGETADVQPLADGGPDTGPSAVAFALPLLMIGVVAGAILRRRANRSPGE